MKNFKRVSICIIILLLSVFITSCAPPEVITIPDGELTAVFIDVGQGDSTLIIMPQGEVILIDAGSRNQGENIAGVIREFGVTQIDYVIATHPHEDHIGGLPHIIRSFPVGKVYMPDVINTTKIFEELLDTIEEKGHNINIAEAGVTLINNAASFEFVSPGAEFNDLNNMSAAALITFGSARFLLTGDAEYEAEEAMQKTPGSLRADVLKAGHHGSNTSSSEGFLDAVRPSVVVISCGAGNSYGHPALETLDRLSEYAYIYRTDEQGTIIISTDGNDISVSEMR